MIDTVISENISEKKKRGRPRLIHRTLGEYYRSQVSPGTHTDRTAQNAYLGMAALGRLMGAKISESQYELSPGRDDWPYKWLCDETVKPVVYRRTILTELGRIDDDDELREVAAYLCEHKPSTREAIGIIRRYRHGVKPADCTALTNTFIRTMNDYIGGHPDVTRQQILMAMQRCLDQFDVANPSAMDDERTNNGGEAWNQ